MGIWLGENITFYFDVFSSLSLSPCPYEYLESVNFQFLCMLICWEHQVFVQSDLFCWYHHLWTFLNWDFERESIFIFSLRFSAHHILMFSVHHLWVFVHMDILRASIFNFCARWFVENIKYLCNRIFFVEIIIFEPFWIVILSERQSSFFLEFDVSRTSSLSAIRLWFSEISMFDFWCIRMCREQQLSTVMEFNLLRISIFLEQHFICEIIILDHLCIWIFGEHQFSITLDCDVLRISSLFFI